MTEPRDCRNCRDYRGCAGKDWFNYAEIRWCVYQVLWIITHKETLQSGRWPKDPYGSADDNPGRRNTASEASFVKPEVVLAELEARLARTHNWGELLITQIEDGRSILSLSDGAMEILRYVSGFRRKALSFSRWQRQKRYRRKMMTEA